MQPVGIGVWLLAHGRLTRCFRRPASPELQFGEGVGAWGLAVGASAPGAWGLGGRSPPRQRGEKQCRLAACAVLGRGSWVVGLGSCGGCFRTDARINVSCCNRRAAGVSRRLNSQPRTVSPRRIGEPRTFSWRRRITQCTYPALPGLKPGARRTRYLTPGARQVRAHARGSPELPLRSENKR